MRSLAIKTTHLAPIITISLISPLVFAQSLPINKNETLTIGALATFNDSDYATKNKVGALPLFLYDNNRLYIEGTEAGFYAYKDNKHWLRGGLTYDGRSFDPNDATQNLQGLQRRKTSVNAHASYMYITPIGGFELKATTDVLNHSNGQSITVAHRSKFDLLDDKLTLYPKLGVAWRSAKYHNYYYGISVQEAANSSTNSYTAKSGYSPFVAISAKYKLGQHLGVFAHQRIDWLSAAQKNSPLTDSNTKSTTHIGLTYQF